MNQGNFSRILVRRIRCFVLDMLMFLLRYIVVLPSKKEIDFIEVKQGNMIVNDYAVKFEELSRFCLHYNGVEVGGSKCIKFESDVRPEINQFIKYQKIHQFSMLVNKCRIYDEDSCARSAHYKSISEKKSGSQNYGKPYRAPADKWNWKASGGKETSEGGIYVPNKCFMFGEIGHRTAERKSIGMICFNTQFPKPKKFQSGGKVFALSRAETTRSDNLIQDMCSINGIPLIAIIDTGVTHSFISLDCAKKLNLEISFMVWSMVIDTPTNEFEEGEDMMFMSAKQVDESLKDEARVFMIFSLLKAESKAMIGDIPVVCDFPEVFVDDISDFPPEREVEFTIDLVPGTSPVLMAPYIMFASNLSELEKQLENLVEKKFV
ncbi:uncharacterized protein LOC127131831 [Lathyrus oleraceus]|uniref:uncharacterized protein LOC127131831 n=1 Tax=Pisum sativum TaxID=3888 RepID=UPI0021CE812A|nr:uncharacterized protein LOC127131831 [Pisum sativum]